MGNNGFTKLFNSIVTSTIWQEDNETRIVWVTMLAMTDKFGQVDATLPGLANVANVSLAKCEAAINKFLSPDKYSRSRENEGRRIEVIDGGWRLLNHGKYREKRDPDKRAQQNKEAQKRFRQNKIVSNSKPIVSQSKPKKAYTDTEADTDTDTTFVVENHKTTKASETETASSVVMEYWNDKKTLPQILSFSPQRESKLKTRMKENLFAENWRQIIDMAAASRFCIGQNDKNWKADFDWILKDSTNYAKVLEGRYNNAEGDALMNFDKTEEEIDAILVEIQK